MSILLVLPLARAEAALVQGTSSHKSYLSLADKTPIASLKTKKLNADEFIACLNHSLVAYQEDPNAATWGAFWQDFKQLVTALNGQDLLNGLTAVKGLSEIGLRVTEAPGLKVISFTRAAQSHQILVQWQETSTAAAPRGKSKRSFKSAKTSTKSKTLTVSQWQSLSCSATILISDARLVSPAASQLHLEKGARSPQKPYACQFLVLCGVDKRSQLASLESYRLVGEKWLSYPELFANIPPYLLENVQGKPVFSGTNLVFTSSAPTANGNPKEKTDKQENSSSSAYKIVLRFSGNHYVLDTQLPDDAATGVATQFVEAMQKGRIDLVKAWLVDAKLASIPAYLGLYNRPADAQPLKLIPMFCPLALSARFRVITYDRDDLILDIGKIKTQYAVKGLFIAPCDPFAKKLSVKLTQTDKPPSKTTPEIAPKN